MLLQESPLAQTIGYSQHTMNLLDAAGIDYPMLPDTLAVNSINELFLHFTKIDVKSFDLDILTNQDTDNSGVYSFIELVLNNPNSMHDIQGDIKLSICVEIIVDSIDNPEPFGIELVEPEHYRDFAESMIEAGIAQPSDWFYETEPDNLECDSGCECEQGQCMRSAD